jgi:hypothetical protein
MISTFLVAALFLFQSPSPVTATPPQSEVATPKVADVQPSEKSGTLKRVRRIYVDTFGTTEAAQQLQAMLVTSLTDSKRLTVTEDKSKADAILKGFASEKTSQETHAYGSATAVSSAGGGHSGSISGSNGNISGSHSGGFHAMGAAIDDSSVNTETIDSAKASVRLVNSDGDVIWTSTQESKGAKYKGASADVADKIVKQLIRDIEKSEKTAVSSETPK